MRTNSNSEFYEDDRDEPYGESLLKPWAWVAAAVVIVLSAFAQASDITDNRAEWEQSEALEHAQASAEQVERRERAAQAMCTEEYGPQVLAVWVNDDTVECVNPRGRRLSRSEVPHAAR